MYELFSHRVGTWNSCNKWICELKLKHTPFHMLKHLGNTVIVYKQFITTFVNKKSSSLFSRIVLLCFLIGFEYKNLKSRNYVEDEIQFDSSRIGNIFTCIIEYFENIFTITQHHIAL